MENGSNLDETCWSVNSSPRLHVIITPTSRGFRQLLSDEGIDFVLPLSQKGRRSSSDNNSDSKQGVSNNENSMTMLENSSTCTFDVTQSQPPFLIGMF